MSDLQELHRLRNQLPMGNEQYLAMAFVLREIETRGDVDEMFAARGETAAAAIFAGRPLDAVAPLFANLELLEREPHRNPFQTIWYAKQLAPRLAGMPAIPRAKVAEVADDIVRRLKHLGNNERGIVELRYLVAWEMRDYAEAQAHKRTLDTMPRGGYSNCHACVVSEGVHFGIECGLEREMLPIAEKALEHGISCAEEPHNLLHWLLPVFRRHRSPEVAEATRQKAYRLARGNTAFLGVLGFQIDAYLATGRDAQALNVFERHFPWLNAVNDPVRRHRFLLAGLRLAQRLRETGGTRVPITLGRPFPATDATGVDVGELESWLREQCTTAAQQFDPRNGNTWFGDRLTRYLAGEVDLHGVPNRVASVATTPKPGPKQAAKSVSKSKLKPKPKPRLKPKPAAPVRKPAKTSAAKGSKAAKKPAKAPASRRKPAGRSRQ